MIGGGEMRRAKREGKRNGNVGRRAAWLFLRWQEVEVVIEKRRMKCHEERRRER